MSAEEVLLKFLAQPGYKPMRLEAIVQALGGGKEDLRRLSKTIPRLIKAGAVVTVNGHLLALPFGGAAAGGAARCSHSGSSGKYGRAAIGPLTLAEPPTTSHVSGE